MKKFKKLLSVALAVCMVCAVSVTAAAAEEDTPVGVDLMDLYLNPEDYPNTEIIVYATVDEYIAVVANDENLSVEEKNNMISSAQATAKNARSGATYQYLTVRETVEVTSSYSCRPYFYTKFEFLSNPSPNAIVSIENANIDRKWGSISKQFGGSLYYNIEDDHCFYWDLNGDFFDNGSATVTGGGQIGVGGYGSAEFSASYTSDHYAYVQETGNYRFT